MLSVNSFLLLLCTIAFLLFLTSFHVTSDLHYQTKSVSFISKSQYLSTKNAIENSSEILVPKASSQATIVNSRLPCQIKFNTSCRINPFIKYWSDVSECLSSPLRHTSGLSQSNENRKFVVFQPDLGGWNNIRMALEVVIVFAFITGRILVMPPNAVLYLLHMNKKWGDNKTNVGTFIDFQRLMATEGLEVISMEDFLEQIAGRNLLSLPLPTNDTKSLVRKPLWDYLEAACYTRQWSPGKIFLGFNLSLGEYSDRIFNPVLNPVVDRSSERYQRFAIGRELVEYDDLFHSRRAIFFPGHEKNRLLTHYYTSLYFAESSVEKRVKRWVRDRLRYHNDVYCKASEIVSAIMDEEKDDASYVRKGFPSFVAYHIRRGDFQQKQTRLPAEDILRLSIHLVPNPSKRVVYIATDERNRSFFQPFDEAFGKVVFLTDYYHRFGLEEINQNHIGMIEQVVCAAANIFIGTPLSTFTSYITRLRGYMDQSNIEFSTSEVISRFQHVGEKIDGKPGWRKLLRPGHYNQSFYFMKKHMYHLQQKPRFHLPFWVREFEEAFIDIENTS